VSHAAVIVKHALEPLINACLALQVRCYKEQSVNLHVTQGIPQLHHLLLLVYHVLDIVKHAVKKPIIAHHANHLITYMKKHAYHHALQKLLLF
jgi:hypothetical protein